MNKSDHPIVIRPAVLEATHGSADNPLTIGDIKIPAYVLANGQRVLSQRGLVTALGISRGSARTGKGGGARLASIISLEGIKSRSQKDLTAVLANPIHFIPPQGGRVSFGYEATILADICDAVLDARAAKTLPPGKEYLAAQCEVLVRGFARVGIIALVDEVTGFQEIRDKTALRAILDQFLRKEFAAWAKRFPDEFYRQIFRLKNWEWRGMKVNRPRIVAVYTNDLVYDRLAPGLRDELDRRNPKDEKGNRRVKQHQWFTDEIGHPALAQHIHALMALQRAATNWGQFYRSVQRSFPQYGETMTIDFDEADPV